MLKGDSPFSDQDKVGQTVDDHAAIALLNGVRKHRKCGRQARIPTGKHIDVRALCPLHVRRRVQRLLDVQPIEIERRYLRLGKRAWKP